MPTSENNNNNNGKAMKLNGGLKNRIIQRPPPLILDKVSNFYDNETQSPLTATSNSQQQTSKNVNPNNQMQQQASNDQPLSNQQVNNNNQINTTNITHGIINGAANNTANLKFWASLNQQNVMRSRSALIMGQTRSSADPINDNGNDVSSNSNQTTTTKDLTDSGDNNLGPDLVITTKRSTINNSNGALTTNAGAPTRSASNVILSNHHQLASDSSKPNVAIDGAGDDLVLNTTTKSLVNHQLQENSNTMSNNSEFDDSSTHGGAPSENDGGNLIGVDNPTPPPLPATTESRTNAVNNRLITDEPPASASSNRPRSNNPFLAMDEDLLSNIETHNNFHKRPASFIAATDGGAPIDTTSQQAFMDSNQQKLQNLHLGKKPNFMQDESPSGNNHDTMIINQQHNHDQRDSIPYQSSSIIMQQQQPNQSNPQQIQQQQQMQQNIYGVYINYEPTISSASESAVCKPPPSATMQLAHWTEAIYELNNAILETSSVAGGADNGQFIYIVESGDIILELDQIKVSGFTLVEFNELLESKQVHLLSAVQTKHSHGLSLDLKHFLSCSFPKNSHDKELQDLIRENIYRRTIPCTTRPRREGEFDKVDYHFLTKEQFIEMNNRGMLLECGLFGGHYYGTMKPLSDLSSLSNYGLSGRREVSDDMRQPLNASHPALGFNHRREIAVSRAPPIDNSLYENHESLRLHQINNPQTQIQQQYQQYHPVPKLLQHEIINNGGLPMNLGSTSSQTDNIIADVKPSSIVAVDNEALPHGWERVIDQTHGTYYIDHNTQRTQYEMPYEIELTKGSMGFGFTLVEADNGMLLVRSIIPGGPAHMNGTIRPGDILISAVGVSVAGMQHTDIARLFSTFAVGDRVRLTFARSTYVVDANLVPDEYLFSNGTNGDMAVAVKHPSNLYSVEQNLASQNHHILVNQEYELITVTLKRGDQGFGFTISDSVAGQRVKKIQNNELCSNLKQNDILISIDGQDITRLTHKEVVEQLKNCPVGRDVSLTVKRKKRFRSKTPMAMHTENDEFALDTTPLRNCKTPSIDGLMLRRANNNQQLYGLKDHNQRILYPATINESIYDQSSQLINYNPVEHQDLLANYYTISNAQASMDSQSIYGAKPLISADLYQNQARQNHVPLPLPPTSAANQILHCTNSQISGNAVGRPSSISVSDGLGVDNLTGSVNPSESSLPPVKFTNVSGLNHMNQYNNFMNNDKLVMMQMQQQRYQQMTHPPTSIQGSTDYYHMPLYSNSDMVRANESIPPIIPIKPPVNQYVPDFYNHNLHNNYYANNEEIALQRNVQYGHYTDPAFSDQGNNLQPILMSRPTNDCAAPQEEVDEYEYHQVDLHRDNKDSNWGIRLIGGSEVDRAISIGSIVFGGAASKNGGLKSGDEIISINGYNVVGATHRHVVDLISACANQASLIIRRKKYAEACEVVLNRGPDEGFGFVIISNDNCALIGKIEKGSPADRCQQLHKEDRVIAINGNYITPDMRHPEIVNMIKECGSTLRLRIIPADCYTVELIKSSQQDNFGFSMRGGSEYDGTPLYILRVAPKGLARDLLNVGDQIIEINGISTVGMTHHQAATIIKFSDPIVKLKLRRNYITPPSLLVASPRELSRFNQVTAEMKIIDPNGTPNFVGQENGSASSEHPSLSDQNYHHIHHHHQHNHHDNQPGHPIYSESLPLYAS